MKQKEYFTTSELAKILGISRIAVFKKIKAGQIKAKKIGRNFAIPRNACDDILGQSLTLDQKKEIDAGVKKVIKEYSRTLELLGNE